MLVKVQQKESAHTRYFSFEKDISILYSSYVVVKYTKLNVITTTHPYNIEPPPRFYQSDIPPIVLSWNSWNWPLTKRSTRLDLPTADSPSSTSLNWQILFAELGPLGLEAPPRLAI